MQIFAHFFCKTEFYSVIIKEPKALRIAEKWRMLLRKKHGAPRSCFCGPKPQKNVFAGAHFAKAGGERGKPIYANARLFNNQAAAEPRMAKKCVICYVPRDANVNSEGTRPEFVLKQTMGRGVPKVQHMQKK